MAMAAVERCGAAHIGVEQPNERFSRFRHICAVDGVPGHCEESVGVTRNVDLDVALFDVIGLGIVFKAARQQTENADALAGGLISM